MEDRNPDAAGHWGEGRGAEKGRPAERAGCRVQREGTGGEAAGGEASGGVTLCQAAGLTQIGHRLFGSGAEKKLPYGPRRRGPAGTLSVL